MANDIHGESSVIIIIFFFLLKFSAVLFAYTLVYEGASVNVTLHTEFCKSEINGCIINGHRIKAFNFNAVKSDTIAVTRDMQMSV